MGHASGFYTYTISKGDSSLLLCFTRVVIRGFHHWFLSSTYHPYPLSTISSSPFSPSLHLQPS
ncbi:hypothetical protein M8C21_011785 [Ambrosia artemisiifolia]|uniref:Uncharacterized protein n=1 Tax=Ambrosia artemisiifolia TaxID=4212 RepID=A0AAD5GRH7_AMBAR|nr:hypothetical protein M8C21_011785 [Ambrosia artemisiifolia]